MPEYNLKAYYTISKEELEERVLAQKYKYGYRLLILTHHYQRDEIVKFGNIRGDSLMLARKSAESNAEFIVFCGVHFMAESSEILTRSYQKVYLPEPEAGCPMADMLRYEDGERVWDEISKIVSNIIPVLYVNSSAKAKAFCGKHNGSVCTSANAESIIKWAFSNAEKVFFMPDEHLGRNTGNRLGIPSNKMLVWDPSLPLGGNSIADIKKAKLFLWKGYCHVHTFFGTDDMLAARKKYPEGKIVVHPECDESVVKLADGVGSTSYIENYVKNAKKDSVVIVGTELNMVNRLARENDDKKIYPLSRSICPNMYKTDAAKLLFTLENLETIQPITVTEEIRNNALLPLERMLFVQNTIKNTQNIYSLSR